MPIQSIEELLSRYLKSTMKATSTLYKQELYAHLLVIIYSSIDTFGLLNASPSQIDSSGDSFKAWVKKYITSTNTSLELNEVDLWGARCAVLHTFTSTSTLSRRQQARELHYIGGDPASEAAKNFDAEVRALPGGNNLPVHFETLYLAFINALPPFISDLDGFCNSDSSAEARLRNVLQMYSI